MKQTLKMSLGALVLTLAGSLYPAHAQTLDAEKAKIPFDFYVEGQKLPAGVYTVDINVEAEMISLRNDATAHQIFLMGIPSGYGSNEGRLIFEKSGDTYALKTVDADDVDLTFPTKLPGNKQERSSLETPSQVEVAFNHISK
jgi:hypothetical protein